MSVDRPPRESNSDDNLRSRDGGTDREADPTVSLPLGPPDQRLTDSPTRQPRRIGHYQLIREIASGGMGTVYEATQETPRRVVALKLMKHGLVSRSAVRRFEYESQILARLRHPGIAQVYEAGTHRDGSIAVPFFAMEYIPNAKPITRYARDKRLTLRQRLELFTQVCDPVHHGHLKGIIHRDLKPSNILVDEQGRVKIIDFGVARSTDSDMAVTTMQTDVGQLVGTLQYMSPEQCEADPHNIDTRSDVYALGVVLYELLCGSLPYRVSHKALHEVTRIIRQDQPEKLSAYSKKLRGDIETIAFKALEKDRERRYQSAADFGSDVQRFLNHEAITARTPSMLYQFRVLVRRHRPIFAAIAAVFVILVAASAVSTSLYVRAESARTVAEQERDHALDRQGESQAIQQFLIDMIQTADPTGARGRDVTVTDILDKASQRLQQAPLSNQVVEAYLRMNIGKTYHALGKFDAAEEHLRRAVALRQRKLGRRSLPVAEAKSLLAALLADRGDLPSAQKLFRDILATRRNLLGDRSLVAAESHYNLANVLISQGDYDQAKGHLQAALDVCRETKGAEQLKVVCLAGLGSVARNRGDGAAAEPILREVFETYRARLGPNHPLTIEAMNNLGVVLSDVEQYDQAERIFRDQLDLLRALYGTDHPHIASALGNLADTLFFKGEYDASEAVVSQTLDMQRRILGEDHIDYALSLITLARIFMQKGDPAKASQHLQRALGILKMSLPEDHWTIADAESLLGDSLVQQGNKDKGERYLVSGYNGIERVRGLRDRYTRAALGRLISFYESSGQSDKVEQYRRLIQGEGSEAKETMTVP